MKVRSILATVIMLALAAGTFLAVTHHNEKALAATTPIRAAFYYPWYPETWYPGIHYTPTLGAPYNSSDPTVIASQIAAMQYANISVGIASWWGQGTSTNSRIPALLSAANGTAFKWTLYYEPSPGTQASDLSYIYANYAANPNFE